MSIRSGGSTSVEAILEKTRDIAEQLDEEARNTVPAADPRALASTPIVSQPQFQSPLRQLQVNSRFGNRHGQIHTGVDLKARSGTQIYASSAGIVVFADDRISGYGNTVIVRHLGGFSTLYAHASALRVQEGERVSRGQCIAYAGSTGRASGPHLHFEIRRDTRPLDPWPFLSTRGQRP